MALKPGQLKCIRTLDKPIVVAAGAGSGKTFTLTKRIVGALESGYIDDIGQVCAITFTNKAAAELKSRVKSELRACGLAEQALKADDAWISTIHGMCARILRAHAVELDIDPLFKIAEASQEKLFLSLAVDEVLALARLRAEAGDGAAGAAGGGEAGEAGEGAGPADGPTSQEVAALFGEYPADSEGYAASSVSAMLQTLVEEAAAHPHGADAFVLPPEPAGAARLLTPAVEVYGGLCAAAEREKPSASRDKWLAAAADTLQEAQGKLASGCVESPLQALELTAPMKVARNFGSQGFKQQAADCASVVKACTMRLRLAAARPHLATLVALARQVLRRFEAMKRQAGVLDNNDLLVLAARAMENPGIAAQYADRFRLVMVDEFQDTDQLQVDMIKRIAGPGAERLCTVGDAQQSIYRFRGADVSVYRRHLASVRGADPDAIIALPDNFRSHADILALVDCVFGRPDMFGGEFMSLAPGRDEAQVKHPFASQGPRVRVQQVTNAYHGGIPAAQVAQERARCVARVFAQLRDEGHAAGEMAVLLGRMSNAGIYAQALRDEGLSCVVSGGSVFSGTPEAQMVRMLARTAVNPRDTQCLWNVLAGPLFRIPDDELLALATGVDEADGLPRRRGLDRGIRSLVEVHGKASGDPDAPIPGLSPRMACAVRVLGELWRGVGRSQLSRCLMRAVVDSGWIARLEARGPEGLAAAGNVYKAIRLMEDLEKDRAAGPVGMLQAFEEMLELAKEAPGALSVSGGDFVRIMTVHASKGLEFPIVAVSEFADKGADSSRLLTLPDEAGILLSLDLGNTRERLGGVVKELKPEGEVYPQLLEGLDDEDSLKRAAQAADDAVALRAAISERDRLGDEEEAKRLLYVALTRAKECLVVSLGGTRSKGNPNGVPKDCLRALPLALAGEAGFEPGVSHFDFGGSAPVLVEHVALVAEEADPGEDGSGPAPAGGGSGPESDAVSLGAPDGRESFPVPVPVRHPWVSRVPYADAHAGVFSYSSVSEASHEGDLLETLAQRFAVSCDEALPGEPWLQPDAPDEAGFLHRQRWEDALAAQGGDDDGSWAYLGSDCADADKATDFGTAFHRLAQHAVGAWVPGGRLAPPPADRVRALMRACGLDGRQWARLDEALERWFGSDEAAVMASWPSLRAEVPFFVALPVLGAFNVSENTGAPGASGANGETEDSGAANPSFASDMPGDAAVDAVFLEGEIDLLAMDEAGQRARVVDYKTGGHPEEEGEALRKKHVLQACCYAYALLLQGVQEVEASFVRVERARADAPTQPQCVKYRFVAADAPDLCRAIVQAYHLAND